MNAISTKVIPIYYNKNTKKLYFDQVEDFDSSTFHFLKEVKGAYARHATHYIDFKTKSSTSENLNNFISKLFEQVKNNEISFGIPISVEDDNEKQKFVVTKLAKYDFIKVEDNNIITFSKTKSVGDGKLLKIGQGLSYYDKKNAFLFDVGGSVPYSTFRKMIKNQKYTIVISHWHLDHYKYLDKMIDDGLVNAVRCKDRPSGKTAKKTFNKLKGKITMMNNINNYKIIEKFNSLKDLNKSSLLAHNKNWLLTGDQSYHNINHLSKKSTNLQIPHHGALQDFNMTYKSKLEIMHKNFWVSYGKNNRYKHPSNDVIKLKKIKQITD